MVKKYLLDTNACVDLIRNKQYMRDKIMEVGKENCYVSIISISELYYGASNSGRKEERIKDIFLINSLFKTKNLTARIVELYGDIKADFRKNGTPVDDFDILIAATAIVNNYTVVINNTKHFFRVPGIKLEDWREE